MAFEIEVRPLAELNSVVAAWDELATHAVEANIFYEPAFALAAAPLLGADVMAGLVWTSEPPRRLAGFFPVRVERHRYAMPLPVLAGWTHPYAPFGTPLVHRDLTEAVIAAWLDHIADDADLPDLLLLRLIREDGRDIVVDYKSGSPKESDRAQVAAYCAAISAITGTPCSGLLWYIEEDQLVSVS